MLALGMAFVGDAIPKPRIGSAMGLLGTMSAVGTALGPTLGGALIAGFGWQAIFWVNVPLGVVALVLVQRCLPADGPAAKADHGRFDAAGTALLALTLAAYALAMTTGRGGFGRINVALLIAAAVGSGLFIWAETRAVSPLIRLAMFRERGLSASLAMSALVSTVMMATLVVAPFYLGRGMGLATAAVGVVMSVGPVVSALAGVPAGRVVDRFGAPRMIVAGLAGMVVGCLGLCLVPAALGVAGYVIAIGIITAHYALFQAANNTSVMSDVSADQRGVISGLLNLSRNLGLITGASAMGAVFALASHAGDLTVARPEAAAIGMRVTFAVAAGLLVTALVIGVAGLAASGRAGRSES
jgi:MFS family permease